MVGVLLARTALERLRKGSVNTGGARMDWGHKRELDIQGCANEEHRAGPLLTLRLPLTFHHNNVRLRADPLDFGRLLQLVAVGVVGSAALVHAGVTGAEASDANAASGVSYIRGIDLHALASRPVKKLGGGLAGLFALHEPPLHLGDGGPYDLTVQLCAVTNELRLRQGTPNEPRWGRGGRV